MEQAAYVENILEQFRMTDEKCNDIPFSPGYDTEKIAFPHESFKLEN